MKTLWEKFKQLFAKVGKKLYYYIWTGTNDGLRKIANNPALQEMAMKAILDAAAKKLKGDEAWKDAYAQFKVAVAAAGWELGTSILDLILQSQYTTWKFNEGDGKDAVLQTAPRS